MSLGALAVILVAVAVGSFTKGVTGSGLPTVAIPVMAGFIGVERAVVIMAIPTVVTNGMLLWEHRASAREAPHLPVMLACGVVGVVLGVWALAELSPRALALALAAVIAAYVLLSVTRPRTAVPAAAARWLSPPVGFGGGILQGATGIAGPLVATYMHSLRIPPGAYVFSIAAQFQVFAAVQVVAFALVGFYSGSRVLESLLALVPVLVFLPLGIRYGRRLERHVFDRAVLVVLAVMGLKLAFDALSG